MISTSHKIYIPDLQVIFDKDTRSLIFKLNGRIWYIKFLMPEQDLDDYWTEVKYKESVYDLNIFTDHGLHADLYQVIDGNTKTKEMQWVNIQYN